YRAEHSQLREREFQKLPEPFPKAEAARAEVAARVLEGYPAMPRVPPERRDQEAQPRRHDRPPAGPPQPMPAAWLKREKRDAQDQEDQHHLLAQDAAAEAERQRARPAPMPAVALPQPPRRVEAQAPEEQQRRVDRQDLAKRRVRRRERR